MKKLILCLALVACLGMIASPALALPKCPHTNSAGVTSLNFGNCILNFLIMVGTIGLKVRQYVCNAAPAVIQVAQEVLAITGIPVPPEIINICNSIIKVGCSDNVSLADLIAFINTYNQSQLQAKGGAVKIIDPTPIIDWQSGK